MYKIVIYINEGYRIDSPRNNNSDSYGISQIHIIAIHESCDQGLSKFDLLECMSSLVAHYIAISKWQYSAFSAARKNVFTYMYMYQ